MSAQAPHSVVLVRPHHFGPNPQTNGDNTYQTWHTLDGTSLDIAKAAYDASTEVGRRLKDAGVDVHIFDDLGTDHPDSVFVNNWFSTHAGGRIAVYPMYAENRRSERRADIIEFLKTQYRVQEVIDFSGLEQDGIFLEGTGTMVLDHVARIAYTAKSRRADPLVLERFCTHFGYEPVLFDAVDQTGTPIYHTNILMCVGTNIALVGLDAIVEPNRRREIVDRLEESGRRVIALNHKQLAEFAGNAIELRRREGGRLLAMSTKAAASLTPDQVAAIEESCDLFPLNVGPIELAGGSVRCMIAGIHLDRRPPASVPKARDNDKAAKLAAA